MGADGFRPAFVGVGVTDMCHELYQEGLAYVIREVYQDFKDINKRKKMIFYADDIKVVRYKI